MYVGNVHTSPATNLNPIDYGLLLRYTIYN